MIDDYEVMSVPLFFWGYEYSANDPTKEVLAPVFDKEQDATVFPWWIVFAIIFLIAIITISIRRIYILTRKN